MPPNKETGSNESIPRCWSLEHRSKRISIGSACSGWCSELWAAQRLKFNAIPCFAVENDAVVARVCQSCWSHHLIFHDVCSAEFLTQCPSVDFFLAGTPCPSFSQQGLGGGVDDPRGQLLFIVVAWITLRIPKTFILEQVRGLVTNHVEVFAAVVEELQSVKDDFGRPLYSISWNILNPRLHGGIPQHRERVFIVGIRNDVKRSEMQWPVEARLANSAISFSCTFVYPSSFVLS